MKQGNNLDKIFKNGLGEMQLNPPEYVWDNIESALGEKKDRKGLWAWLLGLLLVSGGIVGTYAFLNQNSPNNINSSAVAIEKEERSNDKAINIYTETKNQTEEVVKETDKEVVEESNNKISNNIESVNNKNDDSVDKNQKSTVIKENKILRSENKAIRNNNVISESADLLNNLEQANLNKEVGLKNKLNTTKNINKGNQNILLEEPKELLNQRTLFNIIPLESINNGLTYQTEEVEASEAFIQKNTECYSFSQRGSGRVALEIYGGPAVSLKSLRDITGESLYLTRRNETESARVATNVGFKVEFGIKPNLSVKTGINYTLLNERFDYQNTMEERITIIYVRDMNGVIIDSTLTREFGTREKTTYNRYHLIDIPILISYSVSTKSLSMALNAGAFVNLYFGQKGDIIEPVSTLMPTSITTGESIYPIFKNNVGVSLYAGLSVYYPLRKSIDLVFEPNVRHILRPVTLDVHPIEQTYTIFGANLGLRFRFN